jgi:hypothetical protein
MEDTKPKEEYKDLPRTAKPDSVQFRTHLLQKNRKKRKEIAGL